MVDHVKPLECGGADSPGNMQWQTVAAGKAKDKTEKKTAHFTLGKDELSFWSPEAKAWVEESEEFDVWAGGDATASLHAGFRVAGN